MEAPRARPTSPPDPPVGAWRGLAGSFRVAWDGIVETALLQRNMRIHLVAAVLVCVLGSSVALDGGYRLALLFCVFLVLSAEVANTALEGLVDLVTRDRDPRARQAKDAGAGAVLVLATGSVLVLAAVLLHVQLRIPWESVLLRRSAAAGGALAAATGLLLLPARRAAAVDVALGGAGLISWVLVASRTEDVVFTCAAILPFAVAVTTARRRGRSSGGAPTGPSDAADRSRLSRDL